MPRALGFLLAGAAVGWLVAQLLLALLIRGARPGLVSLGLQGVVFVLVFVGVSLLFRQGRWPSVQVTDAALGLAERGRYVVLPWPTVRSAVIRHLGPFATLHVTLRPAVPLPPAGAFQPRLRAGEPTYRVHVGIMRPSPAQLRAALARHLPEEAAPPAP